MNAPVRIWTLPNIISMYRLAAIPVILYTVWAGHHRLFAFLIVINLVSDILDGVLARVLHQETELGARLDSLGDIGTYALALTGLIAFQREFIHQHWIACSLIVGFYLMAELVSLLRFRRPVSLHLYSTKVAGYAQGLFFAVLFLFGYYPAIFYPVMAICLLNNLEEIIVLLILKQSRTDARGLYWVLKDLEAKG